MARNAKAKTYSKFTGLNQASDPNALGDSEFANCENIDIDNDNLIRRRPGKTQILSGDFRNLQGFSDCWLYTEAGVLKRLTKDGSVYSSNTLRSDLSSHSNVAYYELLDNIYYNDGQIKGMVQNGVDSDWGVQTPSAQPALSAASGNMIAGVYQVTMTYVKNGLEGGAMAAQYITLNDNSAIQVTVQAGDADAIRVYVSPPNGEVLYFYVQVTNANDTITIYQTLDTIPLATQFKSEPPLGEHLGYTDGCMYVAVGSTVYRSDSFSVHLFELDKNYFPFPAGINMMVPVDGGMFVGSDKIYFIPSGETPTLQTLIGDKVINRAYQKIDGSEVGKGEKESWVIFHGEKGIYIGGPNGQLENLTKDKFSVGGVDSGSIALRHSKGMTHAVGVHRPSQGGNMHVSDVITATIRKKGVSI